MSRFFFQTFFVPAFGDRANKIGAFFFGCFFQQKRRAARPAGLWNRAIPRGIIAFGVLVTGKKCFPAAGFFLNQHAGTAIVRALYTGIDRFARCAVRLGIFTFRISAAGQKFSIPTLFNGHRTVAFGTYFIGGFVRIGGF